MTTGSALNFVWRSSQRRIEQRPIKKAPPAGTFWRRAAAANAAMLSFHREEGGVGAARPIGPAARANVTANHVGARRRARRIREGMPLSTYEPDFGRQIFRKWPLTANRVGNTRETVS